MQRSWSGDQDKWTANGASSSSSWRINTSTQQQQLHTTTTTTSTTPTAGGRRHRGRWWQIATTEISTTVTAIPSASWSPSPSPPRTGTRINTLPSTWCGSRVRASRGWAGARTSSRSRQPPTLVLCRIKISVYLCFVNVWWSVKCLSTIKCVSL